MVDGVPQQHTGRGMYQPARGDRVKVLGPETPKFVVSNGLLREFLDLTVTHNSEQVLRGDIPGRNDPHQYEMDPLSITSQTHWSYEGTNFFEGITEWEVEIPDPSQTYVAEFQGCCRVSKMAPMQSNKGCIEARYGRGVLQQCDTPYFLRATVNLNFVPPPVSFLPQILPYAFLTPEATFQQRLELPILDYRTTAKGMQKIVPQEVQWPEKITQDELEAHGNLYERPDIAVDNADLLHSDTSHGQASPRATQSGSRSQSSRRLLDGHEGGEVIQVDLDPLPKFPRPPPNELGVQEGDVYQVYATAEVTGISTRMLDLEQADHMTLYSSTACRGHRLYIPPGSDVCDHSFVDMYDCHHGKSRHVDKRCFNSSSVPVAGNVASILVPPGLFIKMTDRCEVSDPYRLDSATIVGECDNTMGDASMCCNVTAAEVRTFRATRPSAAKKCTQQDISCANVFETSKYIHEALKVEYGEGQNGVRTTFLTRPTTRADLTMGNYPVTLMIGTQTSGITMVEFVLKVLTQISESSIVSMVGGSNYNSNRLETVNIPTNFEYSFTWQFTGQLSLYGNVYFQTIDDGGYAFGSGPRVVNYPLDVKDETKVDDDVPANGKFTWTPCLESAGMYYYCASAVSIPAQDFSEATYEWAEFRCIKMRVAEDIPPRVTFYRSDMPFKDQDKFEMAMGQSLEAVVNASDNFQDSIDFVG